MTISGDLGKVRPRVPKSRGGTTAPINLAETPGSLNGQIVPLIPLLRREGMTDGSWDKIQIAGNVATFDATGKREQLWHDFAMLQSQEMTLRAKVRIAPEAANGYAKLVFVGHNEPDYYLIISDDSASIQAWVQSSQTSREIEIVSPKIPWPGEPGQFVEVAITASQGQLRVQVGDRSFNEIPLKSKQPMAIALNVGGWKCDFQAPEVEFHRPGDGRR